MYIDKTMEIATSSFNKLSYISLLTTIKTKRMDTTKETMSRLKLLGSLKKGEKINTKSISVQNNSFLTTIDRTFFHQDNRNNMVFFVEETLSRTFDIIERYEKSEKQTERVLRDRLIDDLISSINGIDRLKETYMSDTKTVCDLETFIEIIDSKLSEYCKDVYLSRKKLQKLL